MPSAPDKSASALRYAGLASQWLVLLGLAVWGGMKLDGRLHFRALLVIILPLVALSYSLWSLIRSLNKTDKS